MTTGQREPAGGWLPAVDVEQAKDTMVLKMDIPGIPRDQISIDVHGNSLTISGTREEERQEQHEGYVVRERTCGSFARSFTLPPHAKADEITADIQEGVLKVTIPRPTEEPPRQITIS